MTTTPQRFPLTWPPGWKRTEPVDRKRAPFNQYTESAGYRSMSELTVATALERLQTQLERMVGVSHVVLSTNLAVRLDGRLRADQGEPSDPGAALYFRLHGEPRTLACDRWRRVADNIGAIAAHVEAVRAVDRYGVGTLEQAFAGYTALMAAPVEWWVVLGIPRTSTLDEVERRFKVLARDAHPDVSGGSHDGMVRLTEAREAARRELTR